MKTRKLLSALLTLAMVVTMVATLGISASAGSGLVYETVNEGETKTVTFNSKLVSAFTVSTDETEGSLKSITASDPTAVTISNIQADGNDISMDVTGVKKADEVGFSITYYDGSAWQTAEVAVCVGVKAQANLDLTNNTKTLDQLYNATVTEKKTDVTKVQVSWELTDLVATVTVNKIWDPENLQWIDNTNSETTVTAEAVTAQFDFVNLSSVKVDAKVEFKAATGISATPTYKDNDETDAGDGEIELDTANTTEASYDNTGKVVVTVPADTTFFKTLTQDVADGTYGTYTVTISKYIPKTFTFAGFFDEKKGNATVNGMKASELCQFMVDNDMITDESKFGDVVVKSTYISKISGKTTIERTLSLLLNTAAQGEEINKFTDGFGDNEMTPDKNLLNPFNGTFTWDGTSFNQQVK